MALRQHRETVVVPAGRGTIVDRNGEPLAIGEAHRRPSTRTRVRSADARDVTLAAAKQLGVDPATLYPTLDDRSTRLRLRRAEGRPAQGRASSRSSTSPASASTRRSSAPTRRAASRSQVLGYAGLDNQGLEGLERSLDGELAGHAREPDDREGPVRSRARRRRDEARDAGQERPPDDRPRGPGERARTSCRTTVRRWGARVGDRDRHGSAHGRDPGHGRRAGVQRQPLPDDATPTAAATARSPTRTSRGRPSSS